MGLYIFALTLTMIVPPNSEIQENYFSTVASSMFTLLIHGLFFGNIDNFAYELKEESPVALVIFLISLPIGVSVMVMGVGILLEVVSTVASCEKDKLASAWLRQQFADCMNGSNEARSPLS